MSQSFRRHQLMFRRRLYVRILFILGALSFSALYSCRSPKGQSLTNADAPLAFQNSSDGVMDSINPSDSSLPYNIIDTFAQPEYGVPVNNYVPVDGPKKYGVRPLD